MNKFLFSIWKCVSGVLATYIVCRSLNNNCRTYKSFSISADDSLEFLLDSVGGLRLSEADLIPETGFGLFVKAGDPSADPFLECPGESIISSELCLEGPNELLAEDCGVLAL